jgi:hypothetical protein
MEIGSSSFGKNPSKTRNSVEYFSEMIQQHLRYCQHLRNVCKDGHDFLQGHYSYEAACYALPIFYDAANGKWCDVMKSRNAPHLYAQIMRVFN